MQCEEIQLDLTAYLDDRLPAERRAAVEQHLSVCQECSGEATALREFGNRLSQGLKDWVDQGVCPPAVLEQLELSLRTGRSKVWWQRWPAYAGAVAAAAAVFLVIMSARYDLSQQMASVPLVGTLAAQIFYPGADVRVDDIPETTAIEAVDEHDGVTLALHTLMTGADATRVQYSLRGAELDIDAAKSRYGAALSDTKGTLKLRSLRITRAAGEVLVTAEYEPVLPGRALTLSVSDLPLRAEKPELVWQIHIKR